MELAERSIDVSRREEQSAEREAFVAARELAARVKQHEADEVIAVAQAVANGDVSLLEQAEPEDAEGPGPDKPSLARRVFGRALATIRGDERAAARAEVSGAFGEISAADDAIVQIASLLPAPLRAKIAEARRSLTKRIVGLALGEDKREDAKRKPPPRE